MPYPLPVLVNDFAIRSFRDTADQDYIAARLAFRHRLFPQFYWAALQAIEKYLKCILVLNRIRAEKGHVLADLLQAVSAKGKFDLRLHAKTKSFIDHLDDYGSYRYFEVSWAIEGHELLELDRSVWDVRKYARVLVDSELAGGERRERLLREELDRTHSAGSQHPQLHVLKGGLLEKIVSDDAHPARRALIWQNACFGRSRRRNVKYWPGLWAANAPLTLNPQILDEVLKYVWLPNDLRVAYRKHKAT